MVLFREENLAELAESFPVSYAGHAEVLEALSVYRPRAVFVDFAFIDARSAEDQATARPRHLRSQRAGHGVPVSPRPRRAPSTESGPGPWLRSTRRCGVREPVNAQMDVEEG